VSENPAVTIIDIAATLGVDMLMLGAPHRSSMVKLLRGDIVAEVARNLPKTSSSSSTVERLCPKFFRVAWERWRLAGELRFSTTDWPARHRRSQERTVLIRW